MVNKELVKNIKRYMFLIYVNLTVESVLNNMINFVESFVYKYCV